MSASDKKKIRKEENMAKLTERQQTAKKEAKRLKTNTIAFAVVIALVFVVGLSLIGYNMYASSGLPERNTVAVKIGDHTISAAELNYYYIDNLNQLSQDWYSTYLLQYEDGFQPSVALDQQQYKDEVGKTWADYFIDEAVNEASGVLALCDAAKEVGYVLTEADKASMEDTILAMETQGFLYGYTKLEDYLQAIYGNGAQEKTFRAYLENMALAQSYYNNYVDSYNFTAEQMSAKENEVPGYFSSYDYTFFALTPDQFMEHTHDEDGKEVHEHSDEDIAAALVKAEEVAKELVATNASTKEQLDIAISELEMYKTEATADEAIASTEGELDGGSDIAVDAENDVTVTDEGIEITEEAAEEDGEEGEETETSSAPTSSKYTDYDYDYIPVEIAEWLAAADRKVGDIGYVAVHTIDDEGEPTDELEGYYVVIFDGVDEHTENLISVRHILVKFEGGSEDEDTGETVYSDEEKKAASDEAERIKAEFEAGEMTAEAFGELAKKYSDDNAEEGGLYKNVYPEQMESAFDAWCFSEDRKAGDTGIVETSYGYHVMYFVETQTQTYREYMINSVLAGEWYTELQESYKASAQVLDVSYQSTSIVLSK